jgi:hypothetical protein
MSEVAKNLLRTEFADIRRSYRIPAALSDRDALSVCDQAEGAALTERAVEAIGSLRRGNRLGGQIRQASAVSSMLVKSPVASKVVDQLVTKQITYEFALIVLKKMGLLMSERTLRRVVRAKRTQLVTGK